MKIVMTVGVLLLTSGCATSRVATGPAPQEPQPPVALPFDVCPPDEEPPGFEDPALVEATWRLCDQSIAGAGADHLQGLNAAQLEIAWPLLWHLAITLTPKLDLGLLQAALWEAGPATQTHMRERCDRTTIPAERSACLDLLDTFDALDAHNAPGADY